MILRLLLSFARKACSLEWHRGAGHPVLAEGLVLARLQVCDILSQAGGKAQGATWYPREAVHTAWDFPPTSCSTTSLEQRRSRPSDLPPVPVQGRLATQASAKCELKTRRLPPNHILPGFCVAQFQACGPMVIS